MVHGQNECDIPTQLPVHEDTQFEALLKVTITVLDYLQFANFKVCNISYIIYCQVTN